MHRWLFIGAVNGFLAVAAGAFGAHGLQGHLDAHALDIFQTGAHYHLIHALATLAAGFAAERGAGRRANLAAWLFTAGIVLFSGSLYVLALTGSPLAALVTPVGGLCFLAGWLALALSARESA